MDISVSEDELGYICEALQKLESEVGNKDADEDRLKEIRKLFQRLQTLHTAK